MPRNIETIAEAGSNCEMGEQDMAVENADSIGIKSPEEMSSIQSVIIRQREVGSMQLSTLKKVKALLDRELQQRNETVDTLKQEHFDTVEKRRLFPDEGDRLVLTSVHPLPIPQTQNEKSIEILP